ncbi:MAG: PUA-like protein [Lachnospiraceae bacterium]|jgi:ASC-1-like (ASCH) protein|nr:PUA-like protein [Lachnospiraceae bacterium]
MLHQLKTKSDYFLDVATGKKTFEVRKNDRDFHIGDFIGLNELTSNTVNTKGEYKETGRFILAEITYVLKDTDYVKDGYVILGIKPCTVAKGELKAYQIFDELN